MSAKETVKKVTPKAETKKPVLSKVVDKKEEAVEVIDNMENYRLTAQLLGIAGLGIHEAVIDCIIKVNTVVEIKGKSITIAEVQDIVDDALKSIPTKN
jgi:pyruvate/2-oxoacid:ferredoxin oxidoreductase alpha subunit